MTSSKRIILKIGGEDLDITELPSVTLGDKRQLKKDGVKWQDLVENDPDAESYFVLMMLRKVRQKTTAAEVDALPAKCSQDVVKHAINTSGAIDSPLSVGSMSLPGTTAGAEPS